MADYVASQTISLDDQLSAGAAAATDALGRLSDAADAASAATDNVNTMVTKAGASAASLATRFDPATKAASDLAKAQAALASGQITMSAAVDSGTKTQAQADAVTAGLTARVRAAQAAVDQLSTSNVTAAKTAAGMTDANLEAANAANTAGEAHAGFYRELVILGHEAITGNFARIPGSLLVLAERSGNLDTIFEKLTATFTTFGGLATLAGVAGVAAIGAIGIEASNAIAQNIALQNSLKATRDDYADMASEVQAAARAASSATPGLSVADATTAGATIAGSPDFSGTKAQLTAMIELAANMGAVFHDTAEKAATDLAAAMENPGQAADKLVGHLRGMTQALADNISAEAEAGDKAGAFAKYEDIVSAAVDGSTTKLSPLRQAMRDLSEAFDDGGRSGGGFGHMITDFCIGAVYSLIEGVNGLLLALNKVYDFTKTVGNSVMSNVTGNVHDTINSVGSQLNAPQDVINLAQAIQPQESPTGQFNSDGSIVQSSAGAIGAMQVMPGNSNGNDLLSLQGNVTAAEQLLISYYNKYNGNLQLVAMAYNWGSGNVDKYLAGQQSVPSGVQTYADTAVANLGGNAGATDPAGATSNNQTEIINDALKQSHNSIAQQQTDLDALITKDKAALAAMQETGQQGSAAWDEISESLQTAEAKYDNLRTPLAAVSEGIEDQRLAAQRMEGAYNDSWAAVEKGTAYNQAYAETIKLVGRDSDAFGSTLQQLTGEYLNAADAAAKAKVAEETLSNGDQLQYLTAETDSLGQNTAARDAMLARLKAEQELRRDGVSEISAEGQAYLASVDAISAQTSALQKNQQTISDLEQLATQAFDQVGTAITNAFASGGKSALDFGNLARTVMSSVLSEVAKLTALNPLLNNLFGGNRTTIGDVGGLLGLGGGTGGIGGGGVDVGTVDLFAGSGVGVDDPIGASPVSSGGLSAGGGLGGLSNILSLGGLLWGNGGLGSSLGLTGGIGGELGLTGEGGLLNSTLWSGAYSSGTDYFAGAGTSLDGSIGSQIGDVSLGGLLGGAGAGFGAGALLNSLLGGNAVGGDIGSGLGGLAGAAIGSIIPGVGTLIGGLIGGAGGGLLGGLFGNNKPSDKTEGYDENVGTGKGYDTGNAVGSDEYSSTNSAAAAGLANLITNSIQGIASDFNLTKGTGDTVATKVGSRDGITAFLGGGLPTISGADTTAGADSVANGAIDSWINSFGSTLDTTTQKLIKEINFTSSNAATQLTALAAATNNGQLDATQLQALPKINTSNVTDATNSLAWVKNSYEGAVNSSSDQGSIATQVNAVNTSFQSLIATATSLGLATDVLVTAQNKQIAAVQAAAQQTVNASGASITAAYQKETGDTYDSNLTTFDQAGAVQQQQLTNEFQGLYGDAYSTQKDYVSQVALLTTTLADQRADLIASWQEQQQAQSDSTGAGWVANITAGWKAQATIASYSQNLGTVQWGQQLDQDADLANFDAQAKTQTDSYSQQLISAYGQSYTTTASYAQQMADLETSLASQRLAIQAQYAQEAKQMQESAEQSASGVITSLTSYIESLQTGSASPLNAQSQYGLTQSQFENEATLAEGGNVQALQELQSYAQAFLGASANLYGSGAQYASDYQAVLQALQAVAAIPQDTLTAAFMQAALQDQTTILSGNLTTMQTTLQAIWLELQQQNAR